MISWDDVVRDVTDNIAALNKSTLESFLKVQPPQYNNPGPVAQVQDIRHQIMRRLDQIESKEQELREEAKHKTTLLIGFLAIIFAAIAAWPVMREWVRFSPPATSTVLSQPSLSHSISLTKTQPRKSPSK